VTRGSRAGGVQPDTELTLTIEKPVAGGRMLARHDGQIVFVAGAIPGERVRARVERVSKHLAFADTIQVIDPSADRREPEVDWACGGSLYAHITHARQLALKSELVADAFARIGKMTLPAAVAVSGADERGYRMRARLHVSDGRFGFFRQGTHELCDAAPTRQLLPATIDALQRLSEALSHDGVHDVTSYEISENVPADERAVLVEVESSHHPLNLGPVEGITGVVFAGHESSRLAIGYGSPYVTDKIDLGPASATLTRHVQSFFQGNRHLLAPLVARVIAHVPEGRVTDLYAGVGLFAVSLAAHGRRDIIAVEGDRSSARDLESNAASSGTAVRVAHVSVERYLDGRGVERPDTLVLDPPRTGMSREALSGILHLNAKRVVYVSCDPATLARDVKAFGAAGYSLEHVEAFDLFPNTAHVETLAVLAHETRRSTKNAKIHEEREDPRRTRRRSTKARTLRDREVKQSEFVVAKT
jgi:tRNA/tmRNA/rRNA uracil-C5-methylase (TrmA/RlmC/RlmD family)